jgi:hypothetical protein
LSDTRVSSMAAADGRIFCAYDMLTTLLMQTIDRVINIIKRDDDR